MSMTMMVIPSRLAVRHLGMPQSHTYSPQVGSAFELEQRLEDPIPGQASTSTHAAFNLSGATRPTHFFDVSTRRQVLDHWRQRLNTQPSDVKQQRLGVVDGKVQVVRDLVDAPSAHAKYYESTNPPLLRNSADWCNSSISNGSGGVDQKFTLTPEGTRRAQAAAKSMAQAQVAGKCQEMPDKEPASSATNRWASYSNLSGSFDQKSAATRDASNSSHQTISGDTSDSQPLLKLFEAELAKIMKPSTEMDKPVSRSDDLEATSPDHDSKPSTSCKASREHPKQDSIGRSCHSFGDMDATVNKLFDGLAQMSSSALPLASRIAGREITLPPNVLESHRCFVDNLSRTFRQVDSKLASLRSELYNGKPASIKIEKPPADKSSTKANDVSKDTFEEPPIDSPAQNGNTRAAGSQTEVMGGPSKKATKKQYKVSKIVARRYVVYNDMHGPRRLQYLVRWNGSGQEEDVWYDAENLYGCKDVIDRFNALRPETYSFATRRDPKEEEESLDLHCRTAGDRMIAHSRAMPAALSSAKEQTETGSKPDSKVNITEKLSNKPLERHVLEDQVPFKDQSCHLSPYSEWTCLSEDRLRGPQFSPSAAMSKFPPVSALDPFMCPELPPKMTPADPKKVCPSSDPLFESGTTRSHLRAYPDSGAKSTCGASESLQKSDEPRQQIETGSTEFGSRDFSSTAAMPKPFNLTGASSNSQSPHGPKPMRRVRSLAFQLPDHSMASQSNGSCIQSSSTMPSRSCLKKGKYPSDLSLNNGSLEMSAPNDQNEHAVHPIQHSNSGYAPRRAMTVSNHPSTLAYNPGQEHKRTDQRFPRMTPDAMLSRLYRDSPAHTRPVNSNPFGCGHRHYPKLNHHNSTESFARPCNFSRFGGSFATEIHKCASRLSEMGFEMTRANAAAEAASGDLEVALDNLSEDSEARESGAWSGPGLRRMPGSW